MTLKVPNHYLANLETYAETKGISPTTLYAETPISPQHAQNLNGSVPLNDFKTVIKRITQLTNDSAFGLSMGAQISPTSHGDLGFAMMSSANLDQAINTLIQYYPIRINLIRLTRTETAKHVIIALHEAAVLNDIKRPIMDMALSTMVNAFRFLTGNQFQCQAIPLSDHQVTDLTLYERHLHSPIKLGQPVEKLIFAKHYLTLASILSDKAAHKISLQKCRAALTNSQQHTPLHQQIRARLLLNKGEFPAFKQLCDEFNMTERTLRRHLEQEGYPFQQILNDTRREMAEVLLKTTPLTIQQIADLLGYSDPSNFGNAFKRWHGLSPKQYRDRY